MLRRNLWIGLCLALLMTVPAAGQLVDDFGESETQQLQELPLQELLQRHYGAVGGEDAWLEVETLKMTGRMQMGPGMEAPFTIYSLRPDKQRREFSFQGLTGIQTINGDEAWMFLPFTGKTEPEVMPEEMAMQMRDDLDIEGHLVNWITKGNTLATVGIGPALGKDAFKIHATLASGAERVYYVDAEKFTVVLMEATATFQGNEVETETFFSNYQEVDDLMFPHKIEIRRKGQPGGQVILIESIEIDPDLSDVEFSMPTAASQPAE